MDQKKQKLFEARAKIVKAMAHPTRLFIVDELSKGEKCVCEITDMIDVDISTVSKHLSVLKASGIIQDQKRGSQVYYTLKCSCVLDFFSCVENVIKTTVQDQKKLVR